MTVEERYPEFAKSVEKTNYLITCRENGQPVNPETFDKAVFSIATSFFNDPKVQSKLSDETKKEFEEYYNNVMNLSNKKMTASVAGIIENNRVEIEKENGKTI